jgi:hypothetical protein
LTAPVESRQHESMVSVLLIVFVIALIWKPRATIKYAIGAVIVVIVFYLFVYLPSVWFEKFKATIHQDPVEKRIEELTHRH